MRKILKFDYKEDFDYSNVALGMEVELFIALQKAIKAGTNSTPDSYRDWGTPK